MFTVIYDCQIKLGDSLIKTCQSVPCMCKNCIIAFNPNLPGLFCELKFLGGGGGAIMGPPPKISTMDGPINLKIGTDTE